MTQPRTTLSELRKLCEKATPGPFIYNARTFQIIRVFSPSLKELIAEQVSDTNGPFFAAARTALPLLIDEIEKLREALKNSIETIHDEFCSGNPHHSACSEPNKTLTQSKERLSE